ncbi:MAG: hypothetical protein IJQ57_07310 [Synergistaceae bacterium]|nr:hypothetical protein [Synergistaceae bacterium]
MFTIRRGRHKRLYDRIKGILEWDYFIETLKTKKRIYEFTKLNEFQKG